MDLAARTARTRIAHFPEIVMLVSEKDPVFREMLLPFFKRFKVLLRPVCRISFKNSGVEPVLIYFVHFCEQFPCPADGFFLEVVPETPVAEHLEHGVVVGVVSDFFQVVMLSADP